MNEIEMKKREYASPVIKTYLLNANVPDFLVSSGEDSDQGEWDSQPEYYIVPNRTEKTE